MKIIVIRRHVKYNTYICKEDEFIKFHTNYPMICRKGVRPMKNPPNFEGVFHTILFGILWKDFLVDNYILISFFILFWPYLDPISKFSLSPVFCILQIKIWHKMYQFYLISFVYLFTYVVSRKEAIRNTSVSALLIKIIFYNRFLIEPHLNFIPNFALIYIIWASRNL